MKEAAMQNDSSANDPRKIWQNQPKETSTVTLKMIRMKVQDLRTKTRRQLWRSWAGPLVVGFLAAFGIKTANGLYPILEAAFVFAIVWSLAGLYFLNRGMRSEAMPGDAALSTGLEFYRREIERQRALHGRGLLWSFGPIVLALGAFILLGVIVAGVKIFPNGMPFLILVAVWFVAVFVIRMQGRRELQREIDDLKDIESQV
jgi:4-amino-4-deoxy-L-arabinose transferase-like glycosyltransferase